MYHQIALPTYSSYCAKSKNTEDNSAKFKSAELLNMLILIKVQLITD